MSLLLDALKKAAEKNAKKQDGAKSGEPLSYDVSDSDPTESIDPKVVEEKLFSGADKQQAPQAQDDVSSSEQSPSPVQKVKKANDEVINKEDESSNKTRDVDTSDEPHLQHEEIEPNATEASFLEDLEEKIEKELFNEDPSLKLALSDEEIVLTDDDVTQFLGNDEIDFDDGGLSLQERSEFDLAAQTKTNHQENTKTATHSLNLVGSESSDETITQSLVDTTSTTTGGLGLGQTANLNSLTNESTVTVQDSTTKTFGTDNYDRTLVKLDDGASEAYSEVKAGKSGSVMTPDFAKKVFVSKSTSLRRRNYKWYMLISLVLLIAISVFALFEMQTQLDEIDSSLVRLKQNPVPAKLRFEKPKKQGSLDVLEGKVDTEALALLKSMEAAAKKGQDSAAPATTPLENTVNSTQPDSSETQTEAALSDAPKEPTVAPNNEQTVQPTKDDSAQQQSADEQTKPVTEKALKSQPKKSIQVNKAPKKLVSQPIVEQQAAKTLANPAKKPIKIKTQIKEKPESVLLRTAYNAYEQGNFDQAQKNYGEVLKIDATNRDALLGQAAIYTSQQQTDLAIDNYQKVLKQNPKDTLAMTSLIAASNMSPSDSESQLKLMQRESPKASYLLFAIGNVLGAQNRWKEAQQYYFDAFQAEPTNADYAYNLAVSMEQIGKPQLAISFYRRALQNADIKTGAFNRLAVQQRIEVLSENDS